jgi:hypothetical protein
LPSKASELYRATVFHIASKVCRVLEKTQAQRVSIGGYLSQELQQIDWIQEENRNINSCWASMELAKSGVTPAMTVIDISAPSTPMFGDLEDALGELDE